MNQRSSDQNSGLRRYLEGRTLGPREALHGICEQACRVANADGVAIALLKAGELVYKAGTGTAKSCVGRRVMATLIASASDQATSEILRVEDAETDSRIQSAICRQFGARSLLILPLSGDDGLSGILQISFDQPHEFQDAEVEFYRALTRLAEPAAAASTQAGTEIETIAHRSSETIAPETPLAPSRNESAVLCARSGFLSRFRLAWDVAIAAVIVIASFGLVLSRDRANITPPRPPMSAQALDSVTQRPPVSLPVSQSPSSRISENPTISPAVQLQGRGQRTSHSASQVRYFGDDVTVRYFAPKTAVVRTREGSAVRHVLDDVTVRYFPSAPVQKH